MLKDSHDQTLKSQVQSPRPAQMRADHWCYNSQLTSSSSSCRGPSDWEGDCKKNNQSPINIDSSTAVLNESLRAFSFSNYDKTKKWSVENNGHTVMLTLENEPSIAEGGLSAKYRATQLHLHWSKKLDSGSEHSLDQKRSAMEMHIVHEKEKSKRDDAGTPSDEIAVLAFLVEAGPKNEAFQPLVDVLSDISKPETKTTLKEGVSLFDLILDKGQLQSYYRYMGSLTTPNCEEKVVWTVFKDTIKLSEEQITAFSDKLFFDTAMKVSMTDNVRPLQSLGKRTVSTSSGTCGRPVPTLLAPTLALLAAGFLR